MNSPKETTSVDDIKKKAAQHGTFISTKLGHSPKKSVKLLGREQMSDFHHNQTTPHQKACGFFFRFLVPVSHSEILFSTESNSLIRVIMYQELWKLSQQKFLLMGVKHP